MRPPLRPGFRPLVLAVLAACGGGGPAAVNGVLHLDLRQQDGRPAAALDAGERFDPYGDPDASDVGLVLLGHDARRGFPARADAPLFASCEVPRGGRLAVSLTPAETALTYRIEVRAGAGWRELLVARVEPSSSWHASSVQLDRYEGEEVELRFTCSGAGTWADPQVRGELVADRRPNVVLITLDTTRADAVGGTWTPRLNELVERGLLYETALSTTNSTIPAHASMFTGLQLQEHGAIGNRHAFSGANVTLAERLRAAGYDTRAAISANLLSPPRGFGQGFDRFQLAHPDAQTDGSHTADTVLGWVDEWGRDGDAPFFLWMHLFDAHTPYGPPEGFARAFVKEHGIEVPAMRADPPTVPDWEEPPSSMAFLSGTTNHEYAELLYHLGVAYADHQVGRVVDALEERGLLDDSLVIVTADHGEALGEQSIWYQHVGLFRSVLQVPLIVVPPASIEVPRGVAIPTPVSAIDIAPTVLRTCGLPVGPRMRGADLLDLARGDAPDRELWFQHSGLQQTGFRQGEFHFIASFEGDLLYLSGATVDEDGRRVPRFTEFPADANYLFEVLADPRMEHDLSSLLPDDVRGRRTEVERWMATRRTAEQVRLELTREEEQELSDLGYGGDGGEDEDDAE